VSLRYQRLRRVPGAFEQVARSFLIAVPKNVGGTRLNACAPRLILETACLVGERDDERSREVAALLGFSVNFLRFHFRRLHRFFLLVLLSYRRRYRETEQKKGDE